MHPKTNMARSIVVGVSILAAALIGARPAAAFPLFFTNQADFIAQTGSTLLTLPNVTTGNTITIPGGLIVDNVSIGGFVSGTGALPVFNLAPNFLAKSGTESFDINDITPLSPMYAFGFTLYEPTSSAQLNGSNAPSVESTFSLTLLSGADILGTLTISPANNVFNFYGFWSSEAITSIQIREIVGSNDNEFFGEFYMGATASSSTPTPVTEPSSLLLAMSGLAGLAGLGLRKRIR